MKKIKEHLKKMAVFVAKESVGRSIPIFVYEVKVPEKIQNIDLKKIK